MVIGIDADEAEYLAEFLDRDECAQRGRASHQQIPQVSQVPLQQVPHQAGPRQSGPLQQVSLSEPAAGGLRGLHELLAARCAGLAGPGSSRARAAPGHHRRAGRLDLR